MRNALSLAALSMVTWLALPACTPLTPAETHGPGPFGGGGGAAAASQITRATNANSGEQYATGSSVQTAARATTAIITKHQASQRQRQVAIQRARAAQQKLIAIAKERAASNPGASASRRSHAAIPRYIAVETVREPNTAPNAQKAVMIWDTQAEDIVGNNVYDISNPPPVGATSRFETYSAEYVGAGL